MNEENIVSKHLTKINSSKLQLPSSPTSVEIRNVDEV
jgi:hypothetical protein